MTPRSACAIVRAGFGADHPALVCFLQGFIFPEERWGHPLGGDTSWGAVWKCPRGIAELDPLLLGSDPSHPFTPGLLCWFSTGVPWNPRLLWVGREPSRSSHPNPCRGQGHFPVSQGAPNPSNLALEPFPAWGAAQHPEGSYFCLCHMKPGIFWPPCPGKPSLLPLQILWVDRALQLSQ